MENIFQVSEADFKAVQEAAKLVPALLARQERLEEENTRLKAGVIVSGLLQESQLPAKGQQRVSKLFSNPLMTIPMKESNGGKTIDVEKLTEAVKSAISEEVDHYKEAGAGHLFKVVKVPTAAGGQEEGEVTPEKVITESEKRTGEDIASLLDYGVSKVG